MAKKTKVAPQEDKRHLNQYKKMRSKLEAWVDPKLCRLDCYYRTAIFFMFKGFQVIVIPQANLYKYSATSRSAKIFFDEDFQMIRTVLSGKKLKKDYDNGSFIISGLLAAIKKGLTNAQAEAAMEEVHDYIIKKSIQEYYKLTENPDNEYFLYGDDQLEPRYRGYQPPITLPEGVGQPVRIKDSSALLITSKDGQKYIDLNSGIHYSDDKFIYFGDITTRQKCSGKAQHDLVSFNSKTGQKTYFKTVVKKGVNLKKHTDKVPYIKADGLKFTLFFEAATKTFYFQDEQNQRINISHPDLMVYLET
jgi:hypothetical protein